MASEHITVPCGILKSRTQQNKWKKKKQQPTIINCNGSFIIYCINCIKIGLSPCSLMDLNVG